MPNSILNAVVSNAADLATNDAGHYGLLTSPALKFVARYAAVASAETAVKAVTQVAKRFSEHSSLHRYPGSTSRQDYIRLRKTWDTSLHRLSQEDPDKALISAARATRIPALKSKSVSFLTADGHKARSDSAIEYVNAALSQIAREGVDASPRTTRIEQALAASNQRMLLVQSKEPGVSNSRRPSSSFHLAVS